MGLKENIKSKRLELGLTLEEVSNKIGIKKPTLQRYESGVISNIPSDKIEALAKVFDVSPSYLMGWEEKYSCSNEKPTDISLTEDEKTIIELYRQLDIEEKIELKGELKGIIKTKQKERVKKEQKQA